MSGAATNAEGWTNVTADNLCPICGKQDWCTYRSGGIVNCRRMASHPKYGDGIRNKSGDCWTYFDNGRPQKRSQPLPEPTVSPNTQKADPDTLHKIYSRLLELLGQPTPEQRQKLLNRGLTETQVDQLGYKWLPISGRAKICALLIAEGLEADIAQTPGFHVKQGNDGKKYWTIAGAAGMLIPVRDADKRIVGLQIRADDSKSADHRYSWMSSKKKGGCGPGSPIHCPAFEHNGKAVRITEGPLKGDIATLLTGTLTIALPGVGYWRKAKAEVSKRKATHALIAFDADYRTNPAVCRHLKNLLVDAQSWSGIEVLVERWDLTDGKGIDDLLAAGKQPESIAAQDFLDELETSNADRRAEITLLGPGYEHVATSHILKALPDVNNLYVRGGQLVQIGAATTDDGFIEREQDTPTIISLNYWTLRHKISESCRFVDEDKEKSPPQACVQAIYGQGYWPHVRHLAGIVEYPVLRADGSVLDQPGYDQATKLFYSPTETFPTIPANPSKNEAMEAAGELLDLVGDFPFASDAHRSCWLAGLLTTFCRRAFDGPAPLFLMDANIRASGKSLLSDIISMIVCGHAMPRMSNVRDDEEMRKRITSLAIAGESLVLIDNIAGTLGCASLDVVLTSTRWKDRKLSTNTTIDCDFRATWFATGNNVVLLADTSRRICHVRLESSEEYPEEREGFRYPQLLSHVKQKRPAYVTAALTVLRAYFAAGRPDQKLKPWGSFERWSDIIRNTIVWLELPDPGVTRQEVAWNSDRDASALRTIIEDWTLIDPDVQGLTADGIRKQLETTNPEFEGLRTAVFDLCGTLDTRRIGNQLRRLKGRNVGGKCITYYEQRSRQRHWVVVEIRPNGTNIGDSGATGDSTTGRSLFTYAHVEKGLRT